MSIVYKNIYDYFPFWYKNIANQKADFIFEKIAAQFNILAEITYVVI